MAWKDKEKPPQYEPILHLHVKPVEFSWFVKNGNIPMNLKLKNMFLVIVDASTLCQKANFLLGASTTATRSWNIKVCLIYFLNFLIFLNFFTKVVFGKYFFFNFRLLSTIAAKTLEVPHNVCNTLLGQLEPFLSKI